MATNFSGVHLFLGFAYIELGATEEAIAEFKKEMNISRGINAFIEASIGLGYSDMGKKEETQQILDDLLERSNEEYVTPFALAMLYFVLREPDKGFESLEKAYDERDFYLCYVKMDPFLETFGYLPQWQWKERYIAILKKMNLEP